MRALFAAIIVAAISAASPAYSSEAETIGYMRDACKVLTSENPNDNLKFGICAGFILGQRAWRDGVCILVQRGDDLDTFSHLTARNTQGHTLVAVAQGFVNWADDHPEHWSTQLHITSVAEDLWAEFPCESK